MYLLLLTNLSFKNPQNKNKLLMFSVMFIINASFQRTLNDSFFKDSLIFTSLFKFSRTLLVFFTSNLKLFIFSLYLTKNSSW